MEKEIRLRIDALKEYLLETRCRGYVVGVSGGQDSTLAGRLMQIAASELGDRTSVGVMLPYGEQFDQEDAKLAMRFILPDQVHVINIKEPVDAMVNTLSYNGISINDTTKGNIKARIRMSILYHIAWNHELLVLGTENDSERAMGYSTKHGDSACDFNVLYGVLKTQVPKMLKILGAPPRLVHKPPIAGLSDFTPELTDEQEMGFSYEEIDALLMEGPTDNNNSLLVDIFVESKHKRSLPATPKVPNRLTLFD